MDHQERRDLYYRLLKERWEKVNKDNLREIHDYNEWSRELRHQLLDEE